MARIRTIKPEFWRVTHDISEGAALLFVALWNFADDYGVVELDPDLIKANVYPRRDIREKDIIDRLDELSRTDRVLPFRVNGERYGWITNFGDHQVINRRGDRLFPEPPSRLVREFESRRDRVVYDDEVDNAVKADVAGSGSDSVKVHGTFSEDSVNAHGTFTPGTGNREQGTGRGRKAPAPAREGSDPPKQRGEFVWLSDSELKNLDEDFGQGAAGKYIGRLNRHIGSTGKHYDSHYWTIRKWLVEDLGEPKSKAAVGKTGHGPTAEEVERERSRLLREHAAENERFRIGVIEPLRLELNEHSWKTFIAPLVVAEETSDGVVVYAGVNVAWVEEHFLSAIQAKLGGRRVVLVSSCVEEATV